VRIEDPKLVDELDAAGVKFRGERPGLMSQLLLSWIVPLGIMILIWTFIGRRISGAGESILGFGRSKARLVAEQETGVTFKDVAGCEEAKYELQEVVDFLKQWRAAEDVVFHEVTTGAENDLEHTTALARQMVCIFGMSERIGLARCAQRYDGLYPPVDGQFQRDCSEKTAQEIDDEVKKILDGTYADARKILEDHRDQLELVTKTLLENETLDAAAFNRLIGRSPKEDETEPGPPVEIAPGAAGMGDEGFPM
jgi:ATP-dependent Zn protease